MSRVTTRDEAVRRYGEIDFASKYWEKKRDWIVMAEVPKGFFPDWKVLDTDMIVTRIACNIDVRYPLTQALEAVHARGLSHLLKTFDGCFNIRMVRGSNTHFSAHSYGLAIDLNASENGLGSASGGFYDHPDFVDCFRQFGWKWGGDFHGRKDPMHFSYCWE